MTSKNSVRSCLGGFALCASFIACGPTQAQMFEAVYEGIVTDVTGPGFGYAVGDAIMGTFVIDVGKAGPALDSNPGSGFYSPKLDFVTSDPLLTNPIGDSQDQIAIVDDGWILNGNGISIVDSESQNPTDDFTFFISVLSRDLSLVHGTDLSQTISWDSSSPFNTLAALGKVQTSSSNVTTFAIDSFHYRPIFAQAIDTGLFSYGRLRACPNVTECVGGDPTVALVSDYDLSVTGQVSTRTSDPDNPTWVQSGTSAGYSGPGLAPAMSAYAYTQGPSRFTIGSWGFQKYTFLESGQVTLTGTVTYDQVGETAPSSQNPRGLVVGSIMTFQFDDNEFDGSDCNIFQGYDFPVSQLSTCVAFNGQPLGPVTVDFAGLQNVQIEYFDIPSVPTAGGSAEVELSVTGQQGDVFFLAAELGILAQLDGWADTGNSLTIDVENAEILQPAFDHASYVPSPARVVNIDVLPDSESNCVNINGAGVIPAVIFGGDALVVTEVDLATLKLGGLSPRAKKDGRTSCHMSLVDGDEYMDMVCQFNDDPSAWSQGEQEVVLSGAKFDGSLFMGIDRICEVP